MAFNRLQVYANFPKVNFSTRSRTMNIRDSAMLILATLAGFAGAKLSNWTKPLPIETPSLVRASKFELVNSLGVPVGVWMSNPDGGSSFDFLRGARTPMSLAMTSDGRPHVSMRGRSGELLVEIQVKESGMPLLGMGDKSWEGRVLLGSIESDSGPESDDTWGLLFRPKRSSNPIATIGMRKLGLAKDQGLLSVQGVFKSP